MTFLRALDCRIKYVHIKVWLCAVDYSHYLCTHYDKY